MEHTTHNPQITAESILHFSAFVICESSDKKHFSNPVVLNYALSYIIRAIKENQNNPEFENQYKDAFWYIVQNYKRS
jgi:hypothetical protein